MLIVIAACFPITHSSLNESNFYVTEGNCYSRWPYSSAEQNASCSTVEKQETYETCQGLQPYSLRDRFQILRGMPQCIDAIVVHHPCPHGWFQNHLGNREDTFLAVVGSMHPERTNYIHIRNVDGKRLVTLTDLFLLKQAQLKHSFLSTLRWTTSSTPYSGHHDTLPKCLGPIKNRLYLFKQWAKINPSFVRSEILSQQWGN